MKTASKVSWFHRKRANKIKYIIILNTLYIHLNTNKFYRFNDLELKQTELEIKQIFWFDLQIRDSFQFY